jgi:hypothetical protein
MAQNRAGLIIAKLMRKHSVICISLSHYHIIKLANYVFYLHKMPLVVRDEKPEHIAHF